MKPLPPYGAILHQYTKSKIKLEYSIFVFVGKGAFNEAKSSLARGQIALCIPADFRLEGYLWPVDGLNLIVMDTGGVTEFYLKTVAAHLLNEGAQLVYLFNLHCPHEIYVNDIEKDIL